MGGREGRVGEVGGRKEKGGGKEEERVGEKEGGGRSKLRW